MMAHLTVLTEIHTRQGDLGSYPARVAATACDDCSRSDQACPAAWLPWEQRTVPGLSFGLIHSSPPPFTGVRVFVFVQATDGGERW